MIFDYLDNRCQKVEEVRGCKEQGLSLCGSVFLMSAIKKRMFAKAMAPG